MTDQYTSAELAASQKTIEAMRRHRVRLSTWGAGFVLALYEAGKDDAAELFLEGMAQDAPKPLSDGGEPCT